MASSTSSELTPEAQAATAAGERALTDPDLVARAQDGDSHALNILVRRHTDKVYGIAMNMVKNPDDAQEVVQDTFLNVCRNLGKFRGDSMFSSWLYRVAVNQSLMYLRKRGRIRERSIEDIDPQFQESGEYLAAPSAWAMRGDKAALNNELGQVIRAAVDDLPEIYRAVFLLRDVQELSNAEIAETLGLSIPAIKSRLHRARLFLRDRLTEYMDPEDG